MDVYFTIQYVNRRAFIYQLAKYDFSENLNCHKLNIYFDIYNQLGGCIIYDIDDCFFLY